MESRTAQQLAFALETMRSFQWQFPCDPVSTKLDTATEAFSKYYSGINQLLPRLRGNRARFCKWESPPKDQELFGVKPLEAVPGILQFLASMYGSGVRNSYQARIRFVVRVLEEHVDIFAGAVATAAKAPGALPWHEEGPEDIPLASNARKVFTPTAASSDQRDALDAAAQLPPTETVAATRQCSDHSPGTEVESVCCIGQATVHNCLKQEVRLHVEKTKTDQRLLPGKTATLQVDVEALDVRIYSIGLLGLTGGTMLSKVTLRCMQCYNIVKTTGKRVTCVLV